MPVTKHITVTQEDIDLGEREKCQRCPIARAVIREFEAANASVCHDVEVRKDGEWSTWVLPPEAHTFIATFDEGRKVSPFEFDMELDEDYA